MNWDNGKNENHHPPTNGVTEIPAILQMGICWTRSITIPAKIYALASILFACAFISVIAKLKVAVVLFACASGVAVVVGFFIRAVQTIMPKIQGKILRTGIGLSHIAIIPLAIGLARFSISSTLGLPPQDFDMTVTIFSALAYCVIWTFLVCVILFILPIPLLYGGIIGLTFGKSKMKYLCLFGDGIGAVVTLALMLSLMGKLGSQLPLLDNVIKMAAYYFDYQRVDKFPGPLKGHRIRLHANGVISTAQSTTEGFVITVYGAHQIDSMNNVIDIGASSQVNQTFTGETQKSNMGNSN